jgi:CBS domain-containing protein
MPNRSVSAVINRRFFLAVPHDLSVQEAAALMKLHKLDAVLVLDRRSLIGICTERDMVVDVLAEGLDPKLIPVSDIMTEDPVTVGPDMTFGNALHLMYEGGFRHIPVVGTDGQVSGVVSARDALELDMIRFEKELSVRQELSEIL